MPKRKIEIMCPKCSWRPKPHSMWQCRPECGHLWNTFDTAGICPACGCAWKQTKCPACHQWSPHGEWYRETIGDGRVESRQSDATVPVTVRPRRG